MDALRYSISSPAERARHVGTVAVTIDAVPSVADSIIGYTGSTPEILVCGQNACVDHIRIYAGPVLV